MEAEKLLQFIFSHFATIRGVFTLAAKSVETKFAPFRKRVLSERHCQSRLMTGTNVRVKVACRVMLTHFLFTVLQV